MLRLRLLEPTPLFRKVEIQSDGHFSLCVAEDARDDTVIRKSEKPTSKPLVLCLRHTFPPVRDGRKQNSFEEDDARFGRYLYKV